MPFFFRKLLVAFATLWFVATLTFLMTKAIGGENIAGEGRVTEVQLRKIAEQRGLNKPLWQQYLLHMKMMAQLDSLPSRNQRGKTMRDVLKENFPTSVSLGLRAFALAVGIGIPIGMICALRHNRLPDQLGSTIALLGVSVPSFVIASMIIFVLCRRLQWMPAADWVGGSIHISLGWIPGLKGVEFNGPNRLWVPALALAAFPFAAVLRLTRASMLEALREDYIRTARAKGLSPWLVVCKHALRNSLVPVVTYLGPVVAGVLTGSLVVEKIFAIPGVGQFFVRSVQDRDMPLILGFTVFYSFLLITMNLIVDSLYVVINPRLRT